LAGKKGFGDFPPGLPDFSWYKIPKRGKICTNNLTNDHKIYQMAVK
jgi:hypothetical protein